MTATPLPDCSLPEGWRWVKLRDVCSQLRTTIESTDALAPSLPYIGLENIESNSGRILLNDKIQVQGLSFKFNDNHVLYGKLRPYLNKVALPTFAGRCSTEIIPLLPNQDVDREYLAWRLRLPSSVEYAMRGKTGSRMPRADMKDFVNLPVPLPPLEEQRRIVIHLEEQMAAAERARRAADRMVEAARALPSALLREIFPLRGENLPQRWRWVKLGEVCRVVSGATPKTNIPSYWDGDIAWITPKDLSMLTGSYIHSGQREITQSGYESCSTELVPAGSVVMSSRAPIGYLGIAAKPLCVNQGCKCFVVNAAIDNRFLCFTLRNYMSDIQALGAGTTFTEVSKSSLERFLIPLPPLGEQQHIVARLNEQATAAERAQRDAEEQAEVAAAIPTSLLRDAFAPAL